MDAEIIGSLIEMIAEVLLYVLTTHYPTSSLQPSMESIRARLQLGVGGRL
jgi:hypothetical protein